jgi:hypothetical protein
VTAATGVSMSYGAAARDRRLLAASIRWRPSQLRLLDSLDGPETLHVWCVARQTGKTSAAAEAAVTNAALRSDLDEILPHGRWRFVPVISPAEDQSRDFAQVAAALVEASPALREHAEISSGRIDFRLPRVDQHGHRWVAKTSIRAVPANSRSIRGLTAALVICEEMGHWQAATGGPADERRVWAAISPMQTRFGRLARTLAISTPAGDQGLFAELLQQIEAGVIADARAVRASIVEMWPEVDRDWLAGERVKLGEDAFRAEYMAELTAGGGALLSEGEIMACVGGAGDLSPREGTDWVVGADFAWRRDRSAAVVLGRSHTDAEQLVVGAVRTWEPAVSGVYEDVTVHQSAVLAEVAELARAYAATVRCDTYEASAVAARLEAHGVTVETVATGAGVKGQMYRELAAKVRLQRIELPDHQLLINELKRLRISYRSGRATVENPRAEGGHGDVGAALALGAFHLAESGGGGAVFGSYTPPARDSVGGEAAAERGELDELDDEGPSGGVYSGYYDSPLDGW